MPQSVSPEKLISLYNENRLLITRNDSPGISALRDSSIRSFGALGFPHNRLEEWRNTDLKESLNRPYHIPFLPEEGIDFQKVFRCNIPHLDTAILGQLNGWYVSRDVPLMELGNGIIMGSLAEAMKRYPQMVEKYFGTVAVDGEKNAFTALNTAFAPDGVFIYIPDNVHSPKPVQLINVIHHDENVFLQSRNLIVLGKNAHLSWVHCDDSYNQQPGFSNIVSEIVVGEQAFMDHYKLQNLNNQSTLISESYFSLAASAGLESHYITLNGGLIRNNIRVTFDGAHGNADVYGIYLMDRKQHVDNQVFLDHAAPDCTSSTHFKGILDEHSSGVFNGHVLVRRDSARTNAYQSNRNILLTETAKVHSKPFLEIYNDDVKCSHGSTTGQLDPEAMFYLRQRSIGEENARMLLMYAFADEILRKITIDPLRSRIEDMIKKRLQGELQICEQCVLHCTTPEHPVEFEIDMSRV
jgi:Fe-S cluster assembly protein SufD